MTREEASSVLDDYDVNFDGHTAEEIAEAFDVAFRALEQKPCEDVISRQAVIDMTGLSEWFDSSDSYNEFVIALSELPPVTPQEPILEKDGTLIVTTEHCENVGRVLVQYGTNGTLFYQDQEPRKEHWVTKPHVFGVAYCSKCDFELRINNTNFCPNCGADMQEGEKDGNDQ